LAMQSQENAMERKKERKKARERERERKATAAGPGRAGKETRRKTEQGKESISKANSCLYVLHHVRAAAAERLRRERRKESYLNLNRKPKELASARDREIWSMEMEMGLLASPFLVSSSLY
jgi:recombinational DNA repair ATPase RecF